MTAADRPVAGVIGWPVAHSLSPRLHGFWLDRAGIDGFYVPMAVAPERLGAALAGLPALGFRGVNVTVPHKQAVFDALDRVTPVARRAGAVNTVTVGEDGTLEGTNTDVAGFLGHLRQAAPVWQADAAPAVILGAGGAARAAAVALLDAGVARVTVVNRTVARAEALASALGDARVAVAPWERLAGALDGAGLLVNTTSLGMAGQPPLTLDLAPLAADAVVYDIVYVPLETPLLAAARARGLATVDGLGMLIHQGVPAFRAFFCAEAAADAATRAHLLAAL
ncbi:shikimate dehydrogenase [Rhodothalassium salexigens]|uniref:shikimate dehydrogenase n=1 Tax=Rhodothalassium salexigens TaxID=1086 RepID=UPI00104352A5|nr:shikimate dehydrogenase [Rhodothalassium salexigens]MBK1637520.1 shikimate dehydrogenase [Rhodothalassium salexigens DSM 2132]